MCTKTRIYRVRNRDLIGKPYLLKLVIGGNCRPPLGRCKSSEYFVLVILPRVTEDAMTYPKIHIVARISSRPTTVLPSLDVGELLRGGINLTTLHDFKD